ncbi:MAG: flagellar motor switch phosphatase FliY [Chitinophagales bacterium]
MSEGILSQDEINALLAAQSGKAEPAQAAAPEAAELTAEMRDAVGEVGNISLGAAATALSSLVNRKVSITTPKVRIVRATDLESILPPEQVLIKVAYDEGLQGECVFLLPQADACVIADLMMGGDGSAPGTLDEIKLSAVAEAMNQMMGAAATALAGVLRERINISPPEVRSIDMSLEPEVELVRELKDDEMVGAYFTLTMEGLIQSEFVQILPLEFSRRLVTSFYDATVAGSEVAATAAAPVAPAPAPSPAPAPAAAMAPPASAPASAAPVYAVPDLHRREEVPPSSEVRGGYGMAGEYGPRGGVVVQPAQFAPLTGQATARSNPNLQLLMDVQLQVTVELGRTRMLIKDILELAKGSLVELEKFAGEPVDILVNGKLVAKGEVVVIDENFGVKVVDIVTPAERIKDLQ